MTPALLVVEDDEDLRRMYKLALRRKPWTLHLTGSAEEADQALQAHPEIQVMLLDLTLPGMSGQDFLARVRADERWKTLKVLVMSGWDDLEQRARSMGADSWARKPANLNDLERQLEALF